MSQKTLNISNEEEISALIEKACTYNDFFIIRCLISNFFSKKPLTEITELINKKTNFYIHTFESILKNEKFLEALGKIAEQFQNFKKNYEGDNFFEDFKEVEMENKKSVPQQACGGADFLFCGSIITFARTFFERNS